jgi:hypothetical protein
VYVNSGDDGLMSITFNKNNGELFYKYKNKEDNGSTSVAAGVFKTIRKQNLENEFILGMECSCYEYVTTRHDEKGEVVIQYCYSDETSFVNADFFKLYKERCLYDFFKTSNRPYMKLSLKTDRKTIVYTATNIEHTAIDENNFIVDKDDAPNDEEYRRYKK